MTEAEMVAALMELGWECRSPSGVEMLIGNALSGERTVVVHRSTVARLSQQTELPAMGSQKAVVVSVGRLWEEQKLPLLPGWTVVEAGSSLTGRRYERLVVQFGSSSERDIGLRRKHHQWLKDAAALRMMPGCEIEWQDGPVCRRSIEGWP